MRIVWATIEDAETLHALQSRFLLYEVEVASIIKAEDLAAIRHSLENRVCLIAVHRGVAFGAVRAQDRGHLVYVDSLWVPEMAKRPSIGTLLLLELEKRFAAKRRLYQIRAIHSDAKSYRAYDKAGYGLGYEEKRPDGLILRLYEKHAGP